jgi:hypothetical protein
MSNANDGPKRPSLESAFQPEQIVVLRDFFNEIVALQNRVSILERKLKALLDASPQPAAD